MSPQTTQPAAPNKIKSPSYRSLTNAMNDIAAQIFGYAILLIAIGLLGWELRVRRQNDPDTTWLFTPGRFRRRLIMVTLLLFVGALILAETYGLLILTNLNHLIIYVCSLTTLALLLFVLAIRDLGDMARSAEKYAVDDLRHVLQEHEKNNSPEQPSEAAE